MKKPESILWIDCETGGVEHKTDALLQLSGIIEENGKEVDSIDLKIKPLPGKIISPEALNVQGRTMEDIEKFEDPIQCYVKFQKFLARRPAKKTTRYVMGGYNADFDCRFINQWYQDISGNKYEYWKYMQFAPVDIMGTLRLLRWYKIIDIENTKLETVCNYFGVKIEAHDSMSDIRATMELSNILIDKFSGILFRTCDTRW